MQKKGQTSIIDYYIYISNTYDLFANMAQYMLLPKSFCEIIVARLFHKLEKGKPSEKMGFKATILTLVNPGDGGRAAGNKQYLLEGSD